MQKSCSSRRRESISRRCDFSQSEESQGCLPRGLTTGSSGSEECNARKKKSRAARERECIGNIRGIKKSAYERERERESFIVMAASTINQAWRPLIFIGVDASRFRRRECNRARERNNYACGRWMCARRVIARELGRAGDFGWLRLMCRLINLFWWFVLHLFGRLAVWFSDNYMLKYIEYLY